MKYIGLNLSRIKILWNWAQYTYYSSLCKLRTWTKLLATPYGT